MNDELVGFGILVVAAALIASVFMLICSFITTENGEKIGSIVKVSKEGIVCKTWEAQLIRGGMNNGGGSFGTHPFDFTLSDKKLIDIAQQAMSDQKEIIVKYHKQAISPCASGSDGYFADSISVK